MLRRSMSGSEPWVRRIGHLAALAVAQGILLAACADSRGVARPTGEIRASGSATVSADPDVAVLSLGVGAVRPTVGAARNAAASSLSAVVTALGAAGVDESDFRTASFQIQPRYRYRDDEEEFVGHEVWHFLEVTVRDVASAGDIIDRAVAAGGASIRVQNVDFRVEDTPMLEREARSLAIQNATEKANFYASQLGVNRGPVLSLSDRVGVAGLAREVSYFAAEAESRGTQFYAGPVRVTAHVEMVFAIE